MRGKQPWYCPKLCLSSRERNVWTADNYQRPKVSLLHYLDRITILLCLSQPIRIRYYTWKPPLGAAWRASITHIQKLFPAFGYVPSMLCPSSWWENRALYDENLTAVAFCPDSSCAHNFNKLLFFITCTESMNSNTLFWHKLKMNIKNVCLGGTTVSYCCSFVYCIGSFDSFVKWSTVYQFVQRCLSLCWTLCYCLMLLNLSKSPFSVVVYRAFRELFSCFFSGFTICCAVMLRPSHVDVSPRL